MNLARFIVKKSDLTWYNPSNPTLLGTIHQIRPYLVHSIKSGLILNSYILQYYLEIFFNFIHL